MFCEYCGNELTPESKFCVHCGMEQPLASTTVQPAPNYPVQPVRDASPTAAPSRPKGKGLLFGIGGAVLGAALLAVILFAAGVFSSGGGGKIEGPGFNTPEEAAKAYLTGLKNQDVDAMVSAFAVESCAEHYDFEAMVERLRCYTTSYEMPFPGSNDYTRQMNIESRKNRIVSRILTQYMLYNAPEDLTTGITLNLSDSDDLANFIKEFEHDTKDYIFKDLTVTAAMSSVNLPDDPDDALDALLDQLPEDVQEELLDDVSEDDLEHVLEIYLSDKVQETIEIEAKTIGAEAEDIASVVAAFEADGDTWVFCPQAIKYNGKWYLQSLQGVAANLCEISVDAGGIVPIG